MLLFTFIYFIYFCNIYHLVYQYQWHSYPLVFSVNFLLRFVPQFLSVSVNIILGQLKLYYILNYTIYVFYIFLVLNLKLTMSKSWINSRWGQLIKYVSFNLKLKIWNQRTERFHESGMYHVSRIFYSELTKPQVSGSNKPPGNLITTLLLLLKPSGCVLEHSVTSNTWNCSEFPFTHQKKKILSRGLILVENTWEQTLICDHEIQ